MSNLDLERRVVLHADDFGFNHEITRGIVEGFDAGLLTSTALLANAPAAAKALEDWVSLVERQRSGRLGSAPARRRLGDDHAAFDLGVHLNLTQGRPLIGRQFPSELLDAQGNFLPPGRLLLRLLRYADKCREAVGAELRAQVEFLEARGIAPTHLNGHQYVELMPVVSELVVELARTLSIAVVRVSREPRHWITSLRPGVRATNWMLSHTKQFFAQRFAKRIGAAGLRCPAAYFGSSHAGRVDLQVCELFLRASKGHGIVELGLHPGLPAAQCEDDRWAVPTLRIWHDPLAALRPAELALLKSPSLVETLLRHGCRLGRLSSLAAVRAAAA
ncbi:MAG TPA: ChbG/HpnK family deacetylase [Pirellulales bacterium]|nr:ChbG/HpnK family deacetylase [Pirellulales bacterium]